MQDLYAVLQVHPRAEPEVIRAAYRALARKYHPDFGGTQARMVELNEAWGVLGDDIRRAAYDTAPHVNGAAKPESEPVPAGPATNHLRQREAVHPFGAQREPTPDFRSGTVLDFGRYVGWSVGALADHDPNYLAWLARAPIGRRLSGEIEAALAQRAAVAEAIRPKKATARRRRRWT
jgi:curved DNA-binding protein CbpA